MCFPCVKKNGCAVATYTNTLGPWNTAPKKKVQKNFLEWFFMK